jgi:hypothetical protein
VSLYFIRKSEDSGFIEQITLGEIPSVLLSECYNDIKTASDAGTGYDKEWEKKIQY